MGPAGNAALSPKDQHDLVSACTRGDRGAQTRLFRAEVQRVHGLLHRVLGASNALDDLIQESFIRIFRSLPTFRGEAQLSTWIGCIVLRVAYEHLRAGGPVATRLEAVPDISSDDPDAEAQLLAREGLRRLYGILDRLDARQRIAFTLHVVDGRPAHEVAALMATSLVATKTRIWRARREVDKRARLDPLLQPYLSDGAGARS
ncbi:MAG TPA: RNA polymerase sigma factor [Polyangia bacterium]|jgi:RNA polymerase sigma-70 factor (ECF subfamily)